MMVTDPDVFGDLDEEGKAFIEALNGNEEIEVESLTENMLMQMKALIDSGYFKDTGEH